MILLLLIPLTLAVLCAPYIRNGWNCAKTSYDGINALNGEVIPLNAQKPSQSDLNPFTDDLTELYAIQAETIKAQIDELTKLYQSDLDTKQKAAVLNKLSTAQNRLIKVKQAEYKLWNNL